MNFQKTLELGLSYNHVSNASLGDKNPGANSYMFNLLKTFNNNHEFKRLL